MLLGCRSFHKLTFSFSLKMHSFYSKTYAFFQFSDSAHTILYLVLVPYADKGS